jgi:hypothetical protein
MILWWANTLAAAGMSTCRDRSCSCFLPTTTPHDDGALLAAETSTILYPPETSPSSHSVTTQRLSPQNPAVPSPSRHPRRPSGPQPTATQHPWHAPSTERLLPAPKANSDNASPVPPEWSGSAPDLPGGCKAMLRIRNFSRPHDTGWEHREALVATRDVVLAS